MDEYQTILMRIKHINALQLGLDSVLMKNSELLTVW